MGLETIERSRLKFRPQRNSFPVQWNNHGVVKCSYSGRISIGKRMGMKEYKPLRSDFSGCVPQIFPKRRHFKEQQQQL